MAVKILTQTLTTDTDAYTANDIVGGLLTFTVEDQEADCPCEGLVTQVTLHDRSTQEAACVLVLFDANPSSSTTADDSAFDINDADLTKIIGEWDLSSYNSISGSSNAFARVAPKQGTTAGFSLADGKMYGVLYTTGTPTYGAADLSLRIEMVLDD